MILWKVNDERECMCDTRMIKYCSKETLIHETIHIALYRNDIAEFGNEELVHALEEFVVMSLNAGYTVSDGVGLFFDKYDNGKYKEFTNKIATEIKTNLQKAGYVK